MNNKTNNTNKPLWEVVQDAHRDFFNEASHCAVLPSKEFRALRYSCDAVEVNYDNTPISLIESKCWHWFKREYPLAINVLQMKLHESSGDFSKGVYSQLRRLVNDFKPFTLLVTLYSKQRNQTEAELVASWKGLDSLQAQHLVLMGHHNKMHIYQVSSLSDLNSLFVGTEGLCLSHAAVVEHTLAKKSTTNAREFLKACEAQSIKFITKAPAYLSTITQPALPDNDDVKTEVFKLEDVKDAQPKLIFKHCGFDMPDADDLAANIWFYNFYKKLGKRSASPLLMHNLMMTEGHDVHLTHKQLNDRVPPKQLRTFDLTAHMRVIAQIYDEHLSGLDKHRLNQLDYRPFSIDYDVLAQWTESTPNIKNFKRSATSRLFKYHYQAEMIHNVRSRAIQRALNALNASTPEPVFKPTEPDIGPEVELTEMITDTVIDLANSIKDNGRDILKIEKQIVLIFNVLKEITIALGDRDAATRH